jgi:hypothetical protein
MLRARPGEARPKRADKRGLAKPARRVLTSGGLEEAGACST